MTDKKILVAYYSFSGNTKTIAEKIQSLTGGDIFEIKPVKTYPAEYNALTTEAKRELQAGELPQLQSYPEKQYDVIFVGTPAWWYTMATPVKTFLSQGNFEGKTIVPFITHGGGGKYNIAKEMGEIAKGSTVKEPLVVYGTSSTDQEIKKWIENL